MPRYHISISSQSAQAILDLSRRHHIRVLDHGQQRTEHGYLVHAVAEPADIQRLKDAGYTVEQHEDVDEHGKARQKEVGRGNRYKKQSE